MAVRARSRSIQSKDKPMQMLDRFAAVMEAGTQRLAAISSTDAAQRREPNAWSKKEELGHLIDSAVNNYARIIRVQHQDNPELPDRKSTRLNSSHSSISYAVFCLKKKTYVRLPSSRPP